ncbi:MAG: hypothetical protein ABFD07_17505 [Methanobacterium sp.]
MIENVEILRNSILPIILENRFAADQPCTDGDVMEFLQDIFGGKEKTDLCISKVDWESRMFDKNGYSDVYLYAVKLPDGRYYLTLEMPDLEDEDPVRFEYILRL